MESILTFVALGCRNTYELRTDMLSRFFSIFTGPGGFVLQCPFLPTAMVSSCSVVQSLSVLEEGAPSLKDVIIDSGCKVLAELSDATGSSGDEAPLPTKTFSRRQSVMLPSSTESFPNKFWLRQTRKVMKELNAEVPAIPTTAKGAFRFLDLGCCPGGFSAYILEKNKLARSLGISLPIDAGGYSYCLDNRQRRQTFLPFDLTRFDLGPSTTDSFQPVPREVTKRLFDLAILGATPLSYASTADEHRLLISQLILGLQGVKVGGTLIVALNNPESPVTARVMYLLDKISSRMSTHKSTVVHQSRSSFFAIAHGIGQGKQVEQRDGYLASLRTLWAELTLGGGREMVAHDLDFIVTVEELCRDYIASLVKLCGKVWEIQLKAVESRMDSKEYSFSSFSSGSSIRDSSFSSFT